MTALQSTELFSSQAHCAEYALRYLATHFLFRLRHHSKSLVDDQLDLEYRSFENEMDLERMYNSAVETFLGEDELSIFNEYLLSVGIDVEDANSALTDFKKSPHYEQIMMIFDTRCYDEYEEFMQGPISEYLRYMESYDVVDRQNRHYKRN